MGLRFNSLCRVVTVSSMAHKSGAIFFDDLAFNTIAYRPFKAYSQSKLANVLFTKELARPYCRLPSRVLVLELKLRFSVLLTSLWKTFPASTSWTAARARWPSRARIWRLPQNFGRR